MSDVVYHFRTDVLLEKLKRLPGVSLTYDEKLESWLVIYPVETHGRHSYIGKTAREAIIKALEHNPPGRADGSEG